MEEKEKKFVEKNEAIIVLVNGEYSPEAALEILTNLLISKIDFHKKQDFSTEIRFGYSDEHSKKRIQELSKSCVSIKEFISSNETKDKKIRIQSNISVQII